MDVDQEDSELCTGFDAASMNTVPVAIDRCGQLKDRCQLQNASAGMGASVPRVMDVDQVGDACRSALFLCNRSEMICQQAAQMAEYFCSLLPEDAPHDAKLPGTAARALCIGAARAAAQAAVICGRAGCSCREVVDIMQALAHHGTDSSAEHTAASRLRMDCEEAASRSAVVAAEALRCLALCQVRVTLREGSGNMIAPAI
eukprot:gnl/TRDRNA2_/TRDRNA2_44875_c0_seq2.p1 gnl/TRDRNA2_/TRDRNA2_44875_c0~~gnl/TRDRNA2_/TRDRNA2_44875_c0_seq2.p1  ORF type:complete len:201 (+),score=40.04 gnl/TRDRNA2_/TRDRNA2_44875_c0_seq2:2-604(+)